MNPMPPPSWPPMLRRLTCSRRRPRTSLSCQRLGTGRYAGLKVPTVCAHSPSPGLRYGSSEAAAAAAAAFLPACPGGAFRSSAADWKGEVGCHEDEEEVEEDELVEEVEVDSWDMPSVAGEGASCVAQ